MNNIDSAFLAAVLFTATVTLSMAAQPLASYDEAAQKVTDTGYIVFVYPADWDQHGEKLCKKLIASEEVTTAASDAALLLAPIYQNRSEKNNARAKKIMGSLGYPGDMADISYPAIIFYDKNGRRYASIHGRELIQASEHRVAELVNARLAAKKQQDALLAKSRAATDPGEKAGLLLASSRIDGVEWPDGLREAMQHADPGDTHGYLAALNFGFSPQPGESPQEWMKRLDAVLANELYTPRQKQRACAAAIGHLRRSLGTMAGGAYITQYAKLMQKLDPDSALGISAPVVMRDWVRQYRYGNGWAPEIIPSACIPMLMHDVPMAKPGIYHVTFKLITGRDGIRINRLRLMDGKRCIASDDTPRNVSWDNTQQVYTFAVKNALKKPCLEITYGNEPDKRSTWGEITVSPQ
ncbi:MAG: hypothetical protein ACI4OS_07030 [Akkermansia sp.]